MKSYVIIVGLLIISYSYEFYCSPNSRIISILRQIFPIDPFSPKSQLSQKYVYFHTKRIKFKQIFDSNFDFVFSSASVRREVEYCQYYRKFMTFKTGWFPKPFNYPHVKPKYQNPTKFEFFSKKASKNQTYGELRISRSIYSRVPLKYFQYFDPQSQLSNFKSSIAHTHGFTYLDQGYFYKPYDGRKITLTYYTKAKFSFWEKLKNILSIFRIFYDGGFSITYSKKHGDPIEDLFSKCVPGDIRVRFYTFSPTKSTIVGRLNKSTIEPIEPKIGTVLSGHNSPRNVLLSTYDIKLNFLFYIFKFCIMAYLHIYLYIFPDFHGFKEFMKAIRKMYLILFIDTAIRSIIWLQIVHDLLTWILFGITPFVFIMLVIFIIFGAIGWFRSFKIIIIVIVCIYLFYKYSFF